MRSAISWVLHDDAQQHFPRSWWSEILLPSNYFSPVESCGESDTGEQLLFAFHCPIIMSPAMKLSDSVTTTFTNHDRRAPLKRTILEDFEHSYLTRVMASVLLYCFVNFHDLAIISHLELFSTKPSSLFQSCHSPLVFPEKSRA